MELCAGIPEGGTTPSLGEVLTAMEITREYPLKINAIIRPRGGDFLYSPTEVMAMEYDIESLARVGVDGLVWGCLTADGRVDMELNRSLMQRAKAVNESVSTTFHRAFDMTRDPYSALEDIIELGFDRILTSAQAATAFEGIELMGELVERAAGRIIIMPGCGVNSENIEELALRTKAEEFHLSARHRVGSGMEYRKEGVSMGGTVTIDEYSVMVTSAQIVKDTKKLLPL